MVGEQSRTSLHRVFGGSERSKRTSIQGIRRSTQAVGGHVHTRAKSSRTIGGGAHTALELNVIDRRHQVGRVHPVEGVRLRVVEGNAVVGHIDTLSHGATHAHAGVANASAGIGCSHHIRKRGKKEGNILPEIHLFNRFLIEVRKGQRGFVGGTIGHYLSFAQMFRASGICFLGRCHHSCSKAAQENGFSH